LKILIITPRIPYPPFRGDKLKIFNIAKQLSKRNSVDILTFRKYSAQNKDIDELNKRNLKVETVKLSLIRSIFNLLLSIFSSIPFQVVWYKSSKMAEKINEIIKKEKYDVIYFHLIRSAQYINGITSSNSAVMVADYTDAVSLYLHRFFEIERNIFKKFFLLLEKKKVEKFEKIAEKFHTLFICSEYDKKYLEEKGIRVNIRILRNGIDTDYFKPENTVYDPTRIIFTGNMPYYANYDAVLYFSKEIFPLILKRIQEAKFFIVGQNPPRKIRNLASDRIIVTGLIPDIKLEYLKSAVNVAPMRFGAGTLNKIIESIALGVPVVATEMAVGGLPEELNKYIFVAENNDDFACKVVEIIQNPKIRETLMKEGRVIIKDLLGWEKIVSNFESYLSEESKRINYFRK